MTDKENHPVYRANRAEWIEQDLSYEGKKAWTSYCIQQHPLESTNKTTCSGANGRYYSRKFYATNPVSTKPPIQKIQSSAQTSQDQSGLKTGSDYLDQIFDENADGEGGNWYSWVTSAPLAALSINSSVWMGISLPPSGKPEGELVTDADYINGSVPPPKMIFMPAIQVLDWVETEGDIRKGQFSAIKYEAVDVTVDEDTKFLKYKDVTVIITPDQIITESKDGSDPVTVTNPYGFVPFVRAEITSSVISEGVQYSKQAVEIDSLSNQNMRDGYFNIIQAIGFTLPVDSEGKTISLSADKIVNITQPDGKIEFSAPKTAPEEETREKIKALQDQLDISVQQAHSNNAKQGASVGSGVAYKELGNLQASSVKVIMDALLDKVNVLVHYTQRMTGLTGEIILEHPSEYSFSTETERLEVAQDYRLMSGDAYSKESRKAYNMKANGSVFSGEELKKINEADNEAIDEAPEIPEFNNDVLPRPSFDGSETENLSGDSADGQ